MKERMEPATLKGGDNKRPLEKDEMTLLQMLIGKNNWAASQTRPDLSYSVLKLSTKANKAIDRLVNNLVKLLFRWQAFPGKIQ